jgi:acyl-CoA synthetase (AMP-forming)/AMP-acid ligase II
MTDCRDREGPTTAPEPDHDGLVLEPWLGTLVRCYPERPRTIIEVLDQAAARFPDRSCLVTPERDVTYRQFAELVEGAARRLEARGVQPGARIAVCLRNGLDIAVAIWACARAGVILVALNTRLRATQWAYMLEHSGPVAVFSHPEFLDELRTAATIAGLAASAVVPVADQFVGERTTWDPTRAFPDQDATYAVIYTSGTTGRPKASRIVHRCTVHSATAYVRALALTKDDRTAITFPLFYITAHIAQITPMMLVGGASVTVAEFDAARYVALLHDEQISYLMVVPTIWPLLLRQPDFNGSRLAQATIGAFGGSPMPPTTVDALRQTMPQLRLFDAYGMTETHSPATILYDHEFRRKPGSVGRPIPTCDARIIGEDGNPLGPDAPGELELRGPMITAGYFADDDATRDAIRDGWLRTGDLARIDAEGYVYLLDRTKDVITRGGFKIYSVELEYTLLSHPAIDEAAVVGIPDPLTFEQVAAYIVLRPDHSISRRDVRRHVAERMADYAVPHEIRIVDKLPRNRTGKVVKTELRDQLIREMHAKRS